MLPIIATTCTRCEHANPGGDGPRLCAIDGVDIVVHVRRRDCPIGKHNVPIPEPSTANRPRPGAELVKLLAKLGITSGPGCNCKLRAALMDARGPQWCRDNTDEIVRWLREEADRRGLPFIETAARWLVRTAVRRAEKSASP